MNNPKLMAIIPISIMVVILLVSSITTSVYGSDETDENDAESPYRHGYDHGCDDAKISDPDDRYINQPGKGPGDHTYNFMRGYNEAFDSCGGSNTGD